MKISVALATYNGERFLRDQLDSLSAQTLRPHELVVSDDGSTDGTLGILEDFRAIAPFAVSISANRMPLGYADNFLKAAALCGGDFVAFCDQDDVWLQSKLARCAELLHASDAALLIHRNMVTAEDLSPTGLRVPALKRSFTARPLRVQPWLLPPGNAMVFSRRLLEFDLARRPRGLSQSDTPMAHDEWTYFIGTALGWTRFSSEALVYYRQHTANVFGAPRYASTSGRMTPRPEDYRFLASRAFERSAFLHELGRSRPNESASYQRAANHYRALGGRLEARAALFGTAGTGRRVGRFARLAASGGYRARTRGGLGLRSFVKDGVGSVLFPLVRDVGDERIEA